MVQLLLTPGGSYDPTSAIFTFHYGSITILITDEAKRAIADLHSIMVQLLFVPLLSEKAFGLNLHSIMVQLLS